MRLLQVDHIPKECIWPQAKARSTYASCEIEKAATAKHTPHPQSEWGALDKTDLDAGVACERTTICRVGHGGSLASDPYIQRTFKTHSEYGVLSPE